MDLSSRRCLGGAATIGSMTAKRFKGDMRSTRRPALPEISFERRCRAVNHIVQSARPKRVGENMQWASAERAVARA